MPKFEIEEYDNDYRAYTGTEYMEFPSKEEADDYCRKESWAGYTYIAREIKSS